MRDLNRAVQALATLVASALLLGACAPAPPPPTATSAPKPAAQPAPPGAAPTVASAKPAAKKKFVFGNPVTPPNMVHLPAYAALELGFFDEVGLDVEIKSFEGGVGTLRAGVAGGLDVVGTSADPLITAIAQGAPVKAIGTYAPKLSVVITTQPDIKSVEDLRGRRIGIQEVGGFNEVMARLLLASRGLTAKDVQYITVSTAGRVPALVQGQIDATTLHIDQYYNATRQKPDLIALAKMWEVAPDWWYSAFVTSEQQIKENREAIVGFLTAVIKAQRFLYQNRDKTIEIGVTHTKQPQEVVAKAYDDLARGGVWSVNDGMPVKMLEYTIEKQVEIGTIRPEQRPTVDRLIDRSLVDEAIKRNSGPLTGDPRWY